VWVPVTGTAAATAATAWVTAVGMCNEGEADGTGEQENELHMWPGIGLGARRSWRDEGRPSERGRGGARRAGGSVAADRGAAGQGDAVR
jgi:hypothetical protein